MANYVKHLTTTPQTQAIPGSNMVKNNASGYGFELTQQQQLERFLLIGSEGGTFYVKENELTVKNATNIINMIKSNGVEVVNTLVAFSKARRAPKADPALFVLALAATYGNALAKDAAYDAIAEVCKTSTQLFTFVDNVTKLRGWSRGLRRGVNEFYLGNRSPGTFIPYQLAKYRQRNGWTHRDILRLTHLKSPREDWNKYFSYAVGKTTGIDTGHNLLVGLELAAAETNPKKVAKIITDYLLTWEMVPTEMLNKVEVLDALLPTMNLMAMIRNLNRFAKAGMTASNLAQATKYICLHLQDKEELKRAGIHPIFLLNALKVYSQGRGDKGNSTWTPNGAIVSALNEAFYLAYDAVTPTNKNIIIGVDVSGSMASPNIANMALSPREAAAALMLTTVNVEPNVEVLLFDTSIKKAVVSKRSTLEQIMKALPNGGGTDCALPIQYALDNKINTDGIQILTDSETWAGKQHAVQALTQYRNKVNKDVKVMEVGMVATNTSLFTTDKNVLHVVGFDATVPTIMNEFLKS